MLTYSSSVHTFLVLTCEHPNSQAKVTRACVECIFPTFNKIEIQISIAISKNQRRPLKLISNAENLLERKPF